MNDAVRRPLRTETATVLCSLPQSPARTWVVRRDRLSAAARLIEGVAYDLARVSSGGTVGSLILLAARLERSAEGGRAANVDGAPSRTAP